MITEKAYAKINLGLYVGPVRHDGYHEVKTIMVPIDIYDELSFTEIESGIVLIDNTSYLVEDNLAYKAAKLFINKYKIEQGVRIVLKKKIPSEAGLGGGSSDAAAVLRGLNRLFGVGANDQELATLASELGSDVPYMVYSKLCKCEGRGEIATLLPDKYPNYKICIIKPPYGLSTKKVYDEYVFERGQTHNQDFEDLYNSFINEDIAGIGENLFNDLEKPACVLCPQLKELIDKIKEMGFICGMCGSGTAIFAMCEKGKFEKIFQTIKYHQIYDTKIL